MLDAAADGPSTQQHFSEQSSPASSLSADVTSSQDSELLPEPLPARMILGVDSEGSKLQARPLKGVVVILGCVSCLTCCRANRVEQHTFLNAETPGRRWLGSEPRHLKRYCAFWEQQGCGKTMRLQQRGCRKQHGSSSAVHACMLLHAGGSRISSSTPHGACCPQPTCSSSPRWWQPSWQACM